MQLREAFVVKLSENAVSGSIPWAEKISASKSCVTHWVTICVDVTNFWATETWLKEPSAACQ